MRFHITLALGIISLLSAATASPFSQHEKRLFGGAGPSTESTVTSAVTTTQARVYTTKPTSAATTITPVQTPKQRPVENKFWKSFKARGVNLGNWLVLERWMDTVFYDTYANSGTDEWSFCETLGTETCTHVLAQHWTDWITEQDISRLAALDYNLLRIPIGHWALIPTTGDEPYVHATQMQHVERVLQYATEMGLHVVLDIHGLPGSQNGKDHSGREGVVEWYSSENQKRSLAAVTAAMNFIYNSPNKAVIAALEIANEPNVTTSTQRKTYESYIKDAKKIVHSINSSMPIMFHDAFKGPADWAKFTKSAKDNYVIDVHGYFTGVTSNARTAVRDVCNFASEQAASKSKTPVFVGEYSVSVGGVFFDTVAWRREFYETQVQQYSGKNVAGSAFWSIKSFNTGSNTTQNNGWSVQALVEAGSVSASTWDLSAVIPCPASGKI